MSNETKIRIAAAQINPLVGDITGNAAKVLDAAIKAKKAGAQIVVFPEMVITGYPIEDLALRPAISKAAKEEVEERFGGLLNAFKYGAPPHGGCAPGIDRIVMLLADEPNLREIIAFPLNQQAQDLLMQAPSVVPSDRLKELHIQIKLPPKVTAV